MECGVTKIANLGIIVQTLILGIIHLNLVADPLMHTFQYDIVFEIQ